MSPLQAVDRSVVTRASTYNASTSTFHAQKHLHNYDGS